MTKARDIADNAGQGGGSKNMVINGDMRIDQRNNGSAVSSHNANLFPVDRFRCLENTDGSVSMQRVADAPTGFEYSLKFTVTGADTSLTTNQFTRAIHPIEGHNISHLNWGTSNAKTCTLSFHVKSSVAGQYYINIFNNAANRTMVKGYTIDTANTWEKKEITIIGDQTGTWETGNLAGIYIGWSQGSGPSYHTTTLDAYQGSFVMVKSDQTNLTATNGATWQLTGVQFELGEKSTDFEHPRNVGDELARCQRYFTKSWSEGSAVTTNNGIITASCVGNVNRAFGNVFCPTTMRTAPTVTWYNGSSGTVNKWRNGSQGADISPPSPNTAIGESGYGFVLSSGITAVTDTLQGHYQAEAEL